MYLYIFGWLILTFLLSLKEVKVKFNDKTASISLVNYLSKAQIQFDNQAARYIPVI